MIVIKLIGGLGNQMFQYAMAKSLAIEKKQNFLIDISAFDNYKLHHYALNNFNIETKIYKRPNQYKKKIINFFSKINYYQENGYNYHDDVFNISEDHIYLQGYFQSEKYFIKNEKEIRRCFQVISSLKIITKQTIEYIEKVNSVSIHIRRGDYLKNPIHNTNKEAYYLKAMSIIEKSVDNPVYFIFSDDIIWAKQNFKTNFEAIFIDFNDALTNFEDIKLMAACKHNIIANSSFSWWGAWLNDNPKKKVIAPSLWFNDNTRDSNDIIPESWIKI
jgi:hypothetical protein